MERRRTAGDSSRISRKRQRDGESSSASQRCKSVEFNSTSYISLSQRTNCGNQCRHEEGDCVCDEPFMNNFLFVLENRKTPQMTSFEMKSAYELCQFHPTHFNIKWIAEEELQYLKYSSGTIFILEQFIGVGYDYLLDLLIQAKDFMIIGPQVLRYMFHHNIKQFKQNEGFPIFTLAMKDVVITSTGLQDENQRQQVINWIRLMGGYYDTKYTLAITHLVAETVLSDKCRAAGSKKLPIMTPSWVRAVWESSQTKVVHATDAEFSGFECPLFFNVNVCFSQVTLRQRKRLEQIVIENGGNCSTDLGRKKTNILILLKGEGEKFKYGQAWNVECLKPEWILDSANNGCILPSGPYRIQVSSSENPLASSTFLEGVSSTRIPHMTPCSFVVPIVEGNAANSTLQDTMEPHCLQTPPFTPNKSNRELEDEKSSGSNSTTDETSSGLSGASSAKVSSDATGMLPSDEGGMPTILEVDEDNTCCQSQEIFNGRKIKISGDFNAADQERIIDMVNSIGATAVTENFDFIITSAVHMNSSILHHKHFTEFWMIDCHELGSFDVPVSFYHKPLFKKPGIEKLMEGIICVISSYNFAERSYIQTLAKSMGAIVQDVFAKKNRGAILRTTHLICPSFENEKYKAAMRWKIPAITYNWLLKCYEAQKIVDTSAYDPSLENSSSNSSMEMPITPAPKKRQAMELQNYASPIPTATIAQSIESDVVSTSPLEAINSEDKVVNICQSTPIRNPILETVDAERKECLGTCVTPPSQPNEVTTPVFKNTYHFGKPMDYSFGEAFRHVYPPLPSPETPKLIRDFFKHVNDFWPGPTTNECCPNEIPKPLLDSDGQPYRYIHPPNLNFPVKYKESNE